eukprot:3342488-Pyramimonas_sp.AAC.1
MDELDELEHRARGTPTRVRRNEPMLRSVYDRLYCALSTDLSTGSGPAPVPITSVRLWRPPASGVSTVPLACTARKSPGLMSGR